MNRNFHNDRRLAYVRPNNFRFNPHGCNLPGRVCIDAAIALARDLSTLVEMTSRPFGQPAQRREGVFGNGASTPGNHSLRLLHMASDDCYAATRLKNGHCACLFKTANPVLEQTIRRRDFSGW